MRRDEFPLINEIRAEDRAKAYQQGRADVLKDIEAFKNTLDKHTNRQLMNACDIILEQIRGE